MRLRFIVLIISIYANVILAPMVIHNEQITKDLVESIVEEHFEISKNRNDAIVEEYEEIIEELYEEYIEEIYEEEVEIYQEENDYGMTYIGVFEITAYEWTGNTCANGNYPTVGYTIACNALPIGTQVYIEGIGYRTVEDRGATWHSDNWLDLYLGDISSCYSFGRQYLEVYIVN